MEVKQSAVQNIGNLSSKYNLKLYYFWLQNVRLTSQGQEFSKSTLMEINYRKAILEHPKSNFLCS
jgi:UV DNA damage repair endonuclease